MNMCILMLQSRYLVISSEITCKISHMSVHLYVCPCSVSIFVTLRAGFSKQLTLG